MTDKTLYTIHQVADYLEIDIDHLIELISKKQPLFIYPRSSGHLKGKFKDIFEAYRNIDSLQSFTTEDGEHIKIKLKETYLHIDDVNKITELNINFNTRKVTSFKINPKIKLPQKISFELHNDYLKYDDEVVTLNEREFKALKFLYGRYQNKNYEFIEKKELLKKIGLENKYDNQFSHAFKSNSPIKRFIEEDQTKVRFKDFKDITS